MLPIMTMPGPVLDSHVPGSCLDGTSLLVASVMSYHILHLLSHNLRVRLKLDQLHIKDTETGDERTVPLADIAAIVCAARDAEFTAGSLRRMAELNVLLLVCNE